MAVITSMAPDPRGAGGIRIALDGQWYCTVSTDAARRLGLDTGQAVPEALRADLDQAADAQAAYRGVVAALGRRGHSRRELERKLVQKGHPAPAVGAALDRAGQEGLVNDAAFAASFVAQKAARGRGPVRLRHDLLSLGLADEVIDLALLNHFGTEPDLVTPRRLATRRAALLRHVPAPVRKRRVLAYLSRRGFSGREVRDLVQEVAG